MYSNYGIAYEVVFIAWCFYGVLCSPVIPFGTFLNNDIVPTFNNEINQTLEISYSTSKGAATFPAKSWRTAESSDEINLGFNVPETYASSEEIFVNSDGLEVHSATSNEIPLRRTVRAAEENVIFIEGICRDCQKPLVRDTIIRCANNGTVSTIVSYDGLSCGEDVKIACVAITDRSDNGDGANVQIKSGAIGQPFLKLNITSNPNKGYNLFLEIRGVDPSRTDCY